MPRYIVSFARKVTQTQQIAVEAENKTAAMLVGEGEIYGLAKEHWEDFSVERNPRDEREPYVTTAELDKTDDFTTDHKGDQKP